MSEQWEQFNLTKNLDLKCRTKRIWGRFAQNLNYNLRQNLWLQSFISCGTLAMWPVDGLLFGLIGGAPSISLVGECFCRSGWKHDVCAFIVTGSFFPSWRLPDGLTPHLRGGEVGRGLPFFFFLLHAAKLQLFFDMTKCFYNFNCNDFFTTPSPMVGTGVIDCLV